MKYLSNCSVGSFESLLSVCARDPRFPQDIAAWRQLIEDNDKWACVEGELPPAMVIDVDDFQHWCWTVAVQPGLDVLSSYVIVLRNQQSERIGGFDQVGPPTRPSPQLDS